LRFDVLTLFPEFFDSFLNFGILSRAREKGVFSVNLHYLRDFGKGNYRQVDDTPFGGGAGMVMQVEPLYKCYTSIPKAPRFKSFYLSPRGKKFDQKMARDLSKNYDQIVMLAGRYEGIDQRFLDLTDTEELSIGDFILTGGEIGVMTVMDSVARLLPGALGNEESIEHESFSIPLLEHDHYSMPRVFEGFKVPKVLSSGDHKKIDRWRILNSLKNTAEKRPDLLSKLPADFFDQLK